MKRWTIAAAAVLALLPAACAAAPTQTMTATCTVDANEASNADLQACMAAHGVSNPMRWANEVQEYRPYDDADAKLQKLSDKLAKYKPSAADLAGILASLYP